MPWPLTAASSASWQHISLAICKTILSVHWFQTFLAYIWAEKNVSNSLVSAFQMLKITSQLSVQTGAVGNRHPYQAHPGPTIHTCQADPSGPFTSQVLVLAFDLHPNTFLSRPVTRVHPASQRCERSESRVKHVISSPQVYIYMYIMLVKQYCKKPNHPYCNLMVYTTHLL